LKSLLLVFLFVSSVFADVYYSKVEPYEVRNISSNVSGLVVYTAQESIGRLLDEKPYIKIDAKLDIEELGYIKEKLIYLRDIIKSNEEMLKNQEKILEKKKLNYKRIEDLKIKSVVEKDREFYDLVNTQNQLINTQKAIQNLKVQITDLKLRRSKLRRVVSDKNLRAKGFVLYEILVKEGQVVSVSTPLAKVADVSKAILTIYLDEREAVSAKNKVVYIDGKKTDYKVTRLLNIADSENISKYMAQIVIKPPKLFSKLVKIELKDE